MDELLGTMMGRYRLDEKIGEGGMAAVYKALDTTLERWVAIKVITSKRQASENFLKRFEREAKALAKLSHPGIMDIHDYGEQDGHPYIVMEYLPNGTLKQYMGRPIRYQQAAKLLAPIAEALAYAHQQGIVHRDIKPANILFSQHNKPMIGDFGIVKLEENTGMEALTQVGAGIGTPAYMSPEQGKGTGVDHRTDIYALGVVFYELITGRRPYEAPTPTSFFFKQMTEPLPDPRVFVPGIPQEVVDFINNVLSIHLDQRVQSMDEFAQTMNRFVTGQVAKPKFEEAPTRMASREEATMLDSQPQRRISTPPSSQLFSHPPATPISTPPASQSFSTPPAQPISIPPAYDSGKNVSQASPAAKKKKKKTWIIFAVIGGLVALALMCVLFLWIIDPLFAPDEEPTGEVSENSSEPIIVEDPTKAPTSEPVQQPTTAPIDSSQLGEGSLISVDDFAVCLDKAGYSDIVDISSDLVVLACDNFDDNRYGWNLQPLDTDYVTAQSSIIEGTLRMQMTSKESYSQYWQWVSDINTGEDLVVNNIVVLMKIRRIQGPAETLIGIDYRETENNQFYSFSVYENGENMTLEIFNGDGYTELSSASNPGWVATDWHILTLMAIDESHYLIASGMNDESYGEISYDDSTLLAPGELSLWIGAVNPGETITYEIDDLLIVQMDY